MSIRYTVLKQTIADFSGFCVVDTQTGDVTDGPWADAEDAWTCADKRNEVLADAETEEEEYDDPQCACGVYRSEHALLGCGNFQTVQSWEAEKEFIAFLDDDRYERIYRWDG